MSSIFVFVAALLGAPLSSEAAVSYTDRTAFEAALGGASLVVEGFDSVPVNGAGFAAVSNGQGFGDFTITSLSIPADIDLTNGVPPVDTGLDGTFLLRDDAGDVLVLPGGGGSPNPGTPSDDDDFRVDLSTPAAAAGIDIIENNVGPGGGDGPEWVRFLDSGGSLIEEAILPISSTLEKRFVGLIVEPGDALIATIEVNEGNIQDDDIAFDNVTIAINGGPPVPGMHPAALYVLLPLAMIGAALLGQRSSPPLE